MVRITPQSVEFALAWLMILMPCGVEGCVPDCLIGFARYGVIVCATSMCDCSSSADEASAISKVQRRPARTYRSSNTAVQQCRGAYAGWTRGESSRAQQFVLGGGEERRETRRGVTHPWTKTQRWSADDGLVWSSMPCGCSDEAVGSKLEKEKGSIKDRPWADSGYVLCSLHVSVGVGIGLVIAERAATDSEANQCGLSAVGVGEGAEGRARVYILYVGYCQTEL